jgi:hypothetical protein
MTTFTIPLAGYAETFGVALNNINYTFTITYRGSWFLDIGDLNNVPIILGLPLVTGIDLLAPYDYLGFVGQIYMINVAGGDSPPTFTNLGTDCIMQYVTG